MLPQNKWDEIEFIIFNTPKSLNLQKLFPTFSEVLLHKVYFIVHQCNYWYSEGKSYNLDIRNHHWFLSLSTNEVTAIKDILVANGIIKCTRPGSKGLSALYTIVEPYDIKDLDKVYQHWYYLNQSNCPLHVQRYVADKGAVRNAATTNWVKTKSTSKRKASAPEDNREAYIKLLELTLIANKIALPVLENFSNPVKETDSTPVTVEVKPVETVEVETPAVVTPEPTAPVIAIQPDNNLSKAEKAKLLLAGLRDKAVTPIVKTPEPKKVVEPLNTDMQIIDNFTMVNYTKYSRATQLSGFMEKYIIERRLKELVIEGYQGSEAFTTENWILTFEIDAATSTVTLTGVKDAEIAA